MELSLLLIVMALVLLQIVVIVVLFCCVFPPHRRRWQSPLTSETEQHTHGDNEQQAEHERAYASANYHSSLSHASGSRARVDK